MGSPADVLAHTQRFYRQRVYTSWVRDYLHTRHLSSAISEAGIGYAPSGWTATTDHLLSLGHSPGDLVRAGVAVEGDRGLRDVMRDRLILPVQDHTGRLVGFLGRANPGDTRSPKYLNTPSTELYEKRSTLYGLGEGRLALAAGATPLIVEGPMDKLAVDRAASRFNRNVVGLASCGTSATVAHIARIRTITDAPIWFCFDADAAGRRAMLHAWAVTAEQGRAAQRVVQLPAGHDPASVQPGTLTHAIRHATPMSVAVAQAQLEQWGRPDNPVKAELMVDALAKRDVARITPEDSIEWISTVARFTDLPISSVQTALIEHLAPAPTYEDLDALRVASFPHPMTASREPTQCCAETHCGPAGRARTTKVRLSAAGVAGTAVPAGQAGQYGSNPPILPVASQRVGCQDSRDDFIPCLRRSARTASDIGSSVDEESR